jgi:phosphonate transport system substrate-binding protein
MVNKGMVRKQDFRIIFTSPLLPGAPYAMLASLPDDLKVAIKTAFVEGPRNDKAAFDRLSDGKDRGFKAVGQDDYKAAIELIDFVDRLHRKQPS